MPRIGLQDVAINASWDKNDGEEIDKEFELIRRKLIPAPIFQDKLERVFNDQTARFEATGKLNQPHFVGEPKYDLVTFSGMYLLAQIATGK